MTAAHTPRFVSTAAPRGPGVTFAEALLRGAAPDGGLYVPYEVPALGGETLAELPRLTYTGVAERILEPFAADGLGPDELARTCAEAFSFDVPIEPAAPGLYVMRLDRGPTGSFKDFGARWMARAMDRLLPQGETRTVLVATSGDTGSAVGAAFGGLERFRVVLLYPDGGVSPYQLRQMTRLGPRVTTLAVHGTFDDCQRMVKDAFADPDLAGLGLTSANSINVGRVLPQAVYYAYAWSRLRPDGGPISFAVPSGNLGNAFGCALARAMGIPVARLLMAVNANDALPRLLETGEYRAVKPSRRCLSSAMDVGDPSNLARFVWLYGGALARDGALAARPDLARMRSDLLSAAVSDAQTRAAMREACSRHHIVLEPHGAVAYAALRLLGAFPPRGRQMAAYRGALAGPPAADRRVDWNDAPVVLVETAHPAKFADIVDEELGIVPAEPGWMAAPGPEGPHGLIPARSDALKEMLLAHGD